MIGKDVDGGTKGEALGKTFGEIIEEIIGKHCRNLLFRNGWSVLARALKLSRC
jgi:hypothetical protein